MDIHSKKTGYPLTNIDFNLILHTTQNRSKTYMYMLKLEDDDNKGEKGEGNKGRKGKRH